jgi:hypothetical protein
MIANKSSDKLMKHEKYERHSNLALLTTVMAMVGFVVLMFVYIGERNPSHWLLVRNLSKVCAVVFWIVAAAFAVNSVKKKKKFLVEYVIYTIIIGFGLFFMYTRPSFLRPIVEGTYLQQNWASGVFKIIAVMLVIYSFVSIAWHIVLATPRKSKKK